jgi:hypothetical protein
MSSNCCRLQSNEVAFQVDETRLARAFRFPCSHFLVGLLMKPLLALTVLICFGFMSPLLGQDKPANERRDQPVSKDDLLILQRADEILSDETKWNRKDDRHCNQDAKAWSLYCALQKATTDILGKDDHRRAALQEVRFAIEDVTSRHEFKHRLMEFNNLPTTEFKDVKKVLKIAKDKVAAKLKEKQK